MGRVNPNAIVLNPADAEKIDLAKDGENRYYYGGPRRSWAAPCGACRWSDRVAGLGHRPC